MHPISTLSQLFVYTIYRIFSLVQDRLGRTSLLVRNQGNLLSCGTRVSHIFLSSGRARSARPPGRPGPSRIPLGGLAQPAHPGRPSRILLTAGCWLPGRGALRSSDRLQIAQIYGTAEICKTGIQQPLTAAYDFRQIPADRNRAQNEIEIGELFCGRLLNLRSHSTQAYEMRPAHVTSLEPFYSVA